MVFSAAFNNIVAVRSIDGGVHGENLRHLLSQISVCICIFTVQEPITVLDALEGEQLD
jgi:hypothetical protein